MRKLHSVSSKLLLSTIFLSFSALCASAQTNDAVPRITQAVDESRLTVLRGNTHPLARPEFDRGPAPSNLPMERMLLVLKRSPQQEAALEKFMAEQLDKSSPNYHKWLTPTQFGQQYGPADQDIHTVTSWLESRGFSIGNVSAGRTVIEFTGDAAHVQGAFHTAIHKFVVRGEEHWANVNDPSIPSALAPVVAGLKSLHNFSPKPLVKIKSGTPRAALAGKVKPQVTFTGGVSCGLTPVTDCFGVGPADFAAIYNVQPLWNAGIDGSGITIAIANDSNINTEDVSDFRTIFGLPARTPTVTVNGTNPGLGADEVEAILDVEWSGAIAKNASIDLVVSQTTNASFGGDLSDTFIVNEATPPAILSESFGQCELFIGTAGNTFYNSTWQQAAAEGITVAISTGDDGSASCDFVSGGDPVQPAVGGLAVNGISSTPFNTAVGGTEFNDVSNPLQFWSTTNSANTLESALGYIPEMTYNDSCTSLTVVNFFGDGNAVTACNDPNVQNSFVQTSPNPGLVVAVGGSGGPSTCITSDGNDPTSCAGGYAKPCWQGGAITGSCTQQSGIATPNDGARDQPDISLFAGDGTISGSAYILCERDLNGTGSNTPCDLTMGNDLSVGGTSVSTQVFAGVMALLDQKAEDKQGLVNPALYALAAGAGNTCPSVANPAGSCIFYDVTTDTIAMPCLQNTPNCFVNTEIGVLPGYNADTGYDLATGLGTMNVANLVNAGVWTNTTSGNDFTISAGAPTAVPSPGGSGQVMITVTANGAFNGNVTFTCSDLPIETTCSGSPVTGSGQTVIMFQTTAPSSVIPVGISKHIVLPGSGATLALVSTFSLCLMWIGFSHRHRRWSTALALIAFALVFASVGCGGGSGGGGGGGGGGVGGTPAGTTNVVVTATSGSIQRSVAVTLTVN
jgi:subtilase family serine protease